MTNCASTKPFLCSGHLIVDMVVPRENDLREQNPVPRGNYFQSNVRLHHAVKVICILAPMTARSLFLGDHTSYSSHHY